MENKEFKSVVIFLFLVALAMLLISAYALILLSTHPF
jgi:hypothetical protein